MDASLRLHTFARRVCMSRFTHLTTAYGRLAEGGRVRKDGDFGDYTDEAYAIFPRYNVLTAVLNDIETLDPQALPASDVLRERLAEAATTASSDFTAPGDNLVQQRAMLEERETLSDIFSAVTDSELAVVEPLFYRRVLRADEVGAWRLAIEQRWGARDAYWYPLDEKTDASLVALDLNRLDETSLYDDIRRFFALRAVDHVIELREFDSSYEVQADAAKLAYTGAEGFWTASNADWIIYCSHEGTITFGGSAASAICPAYPAARIAF